MLFLRVGKDILSNLSMLLVIIALKKLVWFYKQQIQHLVPTFLILCGNNFLTQSKAITICYNKTPTGEVNIKVLLGNLGSIGHAISTQTLLQTKNIPNDKSAPPIHDGACIDWTTSVWDLGNWEARWTH